MEMEGLDSNCSTHNSIAKGKRTKRMRLLTPCGVVAATTTTTAVTSSTSSANSGASSTTTYQSEEEDMANCLILLARGGESQQQKEQVVEDDGVGNFDGVIKTEKGNSSNTITGGNNNKVGFYIYECKTCNRSFPSFQALGGHRASHKKPKLAAEEKKRQLPPSPPPPFQLQQHKCEGFEEGNVKSGPQISLKLGNGNSNKGKIHECSICGSEFTSGQALGGHMRRHRASTNTNTNTNTVFEATSCNTPRPRNILQLDLNLPAPEDDLREAKFQFATTTPALVDCHY